MTETETKREKAACLLEELAEGKKDLNEVRRDWPGKSDDIMLDAVLRRVSEYHNLAEAFDEDEQAAEHSETLMQRCIHFLKSDTSYEWPPMPSQNHTISTLRAIGLFVIVGWLVAFMGMFMSVAFIVAGALFLISYVLQRRSKAEFEAAGDLKQWPFISQQQRREQSEKTKAAT
ncbi:MAG: hypothetical protein ACLFWB_06475 [Armatimonadota bacterium]